MTVVVMSKLLETISQWLKRVVTQPLGELDRWQKAARFAYDLGRFGARQLRYDRAQQMAAALAFRTLFGLLPVLVVATVLVKALGMEQSYLEPLGKLFEFWGLDQVQIIPPTEIGEASTTLGVWLQDRVREAEQVNFAAIGWVGVAITIYAAISLMVTIEESFNLIYRASQGRAWTSRVPVYWFLLTISPMILIASNFVDSRFQMFLTRFNAQTWLSTGIGWLWSVSAIWLLMFAAYTLFPNTRVRLRLAMIGALVAAILLEIGKRTMGAYLENALSLSQLYGSLGLIPLFMFWVYLMWLAVLFGLQVSSTLQHLHGRQLAELEERRSESALVDPAVVVAVMQLIAQRFVEGQATTLDQLISTFGLPESVLEKITGALVADQVVHRLADSESSVALSLPPEQISIERLLAVAQALTDREVESEPTAELLERLRHVQRETAASANLANLLA
jgi:membrane protein